MMDVCVRIKPVPFFRLFGCNFAFDWFFFALVSAVSVRSKNTKPINLTPNKNSSKLLNCSQNYYIQFGMK